MRTHQQPYQDLSDGDITAAIAPSIPGSGVDLYAGIGGAPEAVLAAAAIRSLAGDLRTMIWPRDDEEKKVGIPRSLIPS